MNKLLSDTIKAQTRQYIEKFNAQDEELYPQFIPNDAAAAFLIDEIPLFDCPESSLTETYYYRWWTFRKHIKATENGYIISEFLPDVPWSGPYNSICCAACFHIREGRWLKDSLNVLPQYIDFWLDGKGNSLAYSTWYAHALWEYCCVKGEFAFGCDRLDKLIALYRQRERAQLCGCGLFWSDDDRDGMEYSISGPGLRPTLNSYMYADALAISKFANLCGQNDISSEFSEKAANLKASIQSLLWDGSFFKTIPVADKTICNYTSRPYIPSGNDVAELIGYIPWYFNIPDNGFEKCFSLLKNPRAFSAPFGLTTAEQCHSRFMQSFDHECLWNGPIWPYASSQVLVATANLLHFYTQNTFSSSDYYDILLQYATSQRRTTSDGHTLRWIDENMDPYSGQWLSRNILESLGWKKELGGYERGKDYNHSLFCDLILSGLLGIAPGKDGTPEVHPLIPDSWNYFCVENLYMCGKTFAVIYDKDGTHYGGEPGLTITEQNATSVE